MSFINGFDIVILLESWASKHGTIQLMGYDKPIEKIMQKKTKFGHNPGGIMVFSKLKYAKCIKELESQSECLLWFKLERPTARGKKLYIFCAIYIPPEGSTYSNLAVFDLLEEELLTYRRRFPEAYFFMVGDFNARTAKINDILSNHFDELTQGMQDENVQDRQNKDKSANNYGHYLINLCKLTGMFLANGRHHGDLLGEYTFINQNGKSTIDYLLADSDSYYLIQNFQVQSRVESDHMPLTWDIVDKNTNTISTVNNIKTFVLKKYRWNTEKAVEFSAKLRDEYASKLKRDCIKAMNENNLQVTMKNMHQLTAYCGSNMEIKIINEAKNEPNEWFTKECKLAKIKCRQSLNNFRRKNTENTKNEYIENKRIYTKIKTDSKKEFENKQKENVLDHIKNKNSKGFWNALNKIKSRRSYIHNEISPYEWFSYFCDAFSTDDQIQPHTEEDETAMHELDREISGEEIQNAISSMKNNKSPGPDGIPIEFFSNNLGFWLPILHRLFNYIYDTGTYPDEWAEGIIIPIFKNGDCNKPNNYRPITLTSSLSKAFCSILNKRLTEWTKNNCPITEGQCGFREGRSTIDNIFTLDTIIRKLLTKPKARLYCIFVDFKKAFDTVPRSKLWKKMQDSQYGGKIMKMLKGIYKSVKTAVALKNCQRTDFFSSGLGLKQGCMLSPLLFSIYINDLESEMSAENMHTIPVEDAHLFYLLFADDLTLFSNTVIGLQRSIDRLHAYCNKWGLTVNTDKTKVMVFRRGGVLKRTEKWYYNGNPINVVPYFKYLGVTFSSSGGWARNNTLMGEQGKRALNYIRSVKLKLNSIPYEALCTMFDSMVAPAMTYGSEVWGFGDFSNVENVQTKFCKLVLGVPNTVPNCVPCAELGRNHVRCTVYMKIINYWFRVMDMSYTRYPRKCYELQLKWVEQGVDCWALKVKTLLNSIGMGEVWLFGIGNKNEFLKCFKQRITDINNQEMLTKIQDTDMLRVYKRIKLTAGKEPYLSKASSVHIRRSLAKVRANGLYINVHIGRRHGVPYNERYCIHCAKLIEDEYHVLFICPLYNNIRHRFIPDCFATDPSTNKMVTLLKSESAYTINNLGRFIFYMERIRNEYIDLTSV